MRISTDNIEAVKLLQSRSRNWHSEASKHREEFRNLGFYLTWVF